ncbi:MAG: hypothetical protein M3454_03450 [Actinomycetota bacterium]|nr:hypothetical protein [Actinomycetota bacterium]
MRDPSRHPETRPDSGKRFVRLLVIIVLILVLFVVVMALVGGGGHGPSRH